MTGPSPRRVQACVFDAYGTLFDVAAAAKHCSAELGDIWQPFAALWRQKQLQYTWLRGLMGRHVDFWQVTGDALDFTMASFRLNAPDMRQRLMELYLRLDAYAEVGPVLRALKDAGLRLAILSNGSPEMLDAAVRNAGIGELLDGIYSVESVGVYKPHPSVYGHASRELGLPAAAISFQSSNAWDAYAAKAFGFHTVWINRFEQARERLPGEPDYEVRSLGELPGVLGVAGT
ncbi:MAG: haloacid dehalogenase type II [Alphaproteobacteria bacterium]|nr:haloacid dehalogenase type II [Alphaproteobacteria bacterium]